MDEADQRALASGWVRTAVGFSAFLAVFVLAPSAFARNTRTALIVIAAAALGLVVLLHFIWIVMRRFRIGIAGPLAGLRLAEMAEVLQAVRQGRAVSDPQLAGSAIAYAQQRIRAHERVRILFPLVVALQFAQLIARHTGRFIAFITVQAAPVVVFGILDLVAYRRSLQSEERNWLLYEAPMVNRGVG